ncbi:Uncharacterised protein [Yersinia enterocolitica]|nr:Uncharacterised protein [Yersinia enterocolitica]
MVAAGRAVGDTAGGTSRGWQYKTDFPVARPAGKGARLCLPSSLYRRQWADRSPQPES